MLQLPPFAAPHHFKSAASTSRQNTNCYWFIFSKNQLLISKTDSRLPEEALIALKTHFYMGTWQGFDLFVGDAHEEAIGIDWMWSDLRTLYEILSHTQHSLAGRAFQLVQWNRAHQFCGACGRPTKALLTEHCRECIACNQRAYPKLSLAMIVMVMKDDEILLATAPNFPEPFYSPLAGFLDPGETLEQCVSREVFEEVGLQVKNIRYFGSQPWPLSHALMVGFVCDYQEGDMRIDPSELSAAGWFNRSNLPQLPPKYSLGRILIDAYIEKKCSFWR